MQSPLGDLTTEVVVAVGAVDMVEVVAAIDQMIEIVEDVVVVEGKQQHCNFHLFIILEVLLPINFFFLLTRGKNLFQVVVQTCLSFLSLELSRRSPGIYKAVKFLF